MNIAAPQAETTFSGDFEKDVPKDIQNDIMERIVEAAWGYSGDDDISVIDADKIDALNIEFTGSIMIDGQEHFFHMRDGNNNGTEILSWNEDAEIHREEPDPHTLIPAGNVVSDAIYHGRAESFLTTWEKDRSGDGEHGQTLSSLPGSSAYDAFFAPGTGASKSHHLKATEFGYEIGRESEALPIRLKLIRSIFKVIPDISVLSKGLQDESPEDILAMWSGLKDADTEKGSAVQKTFETMTHRMAKDMVLTPTADEAAELKELGVIAGKRTHEVALRGLLWSKMISFEAIDGFDPKDLPENPVAELFKSLDPELVSSTKVIPEKEISTLSENLVAKMSRADTDVVPDQWYASAQRVGYRLMIGEQETSSDLSCDMAP